MDWESGAERGAIRPRVVRSRRGCPYVGSVDRASVANLISHTQLEHHRLLLQAMADINAIAKQFTDFYYTTFDSNRANLASLYVRHLSVILSLTVY